MWLCFCRFFPQHDYSHVFRGQVEEINGEKDDWIETKGIRGIVVKGKQGKARLMINIQ